MDGSPAQLIKEKLNLVEVLKSYIALQPAGRNFRGLCPFHHEKTPSFMVSPDRGTWHCFGCGEGGDLFAFVMKYENIEFGEALKVLAEKAGVELRRVSPLEYKQFGLLYDINSSARDFFKKELAADERARTYLKERGLGQETIEEFELGFAPNLPDALGRHLTRFGYQASDVIRAGLVLKSDRGTVFDRFRGRIMFPIANHAGKIVGFTGRILPELDKGETGKYMNSPETPVFQKSRILYGFHRSKSFIRDSGSAFMVEGQMDLLMTWQSGVKNVIATSGTALSADHLDVLRRQTDTLVLSFDSDEAGLNALERAIDLAQSRDFRVKVAICKEYKDAAEAVQADPPYVAKMIAGAYPAPIFIMDRYLKKDADPRSAGFISGVRKVLERLATISKESEQGLWLKELYNRSLIPMNSLTEEFNALKKAETAGAPTGNEASAAKPPRSLTRRELLSEQLLAMLASRGDFQLPEDVLLYLSPQYQKLHAALAAGKRSSGDPELDSRLNFILLSGGNFSEEELESLKKHLRREYLKDRRYDLSLAIKKAEQAGDEPLLKRSLEELANLPIL